MLARAAVDVYLYIYTERERERARGTLAIKATDRKSVKIEACIVVTIITIHLGKDVPHFGRAPKNIVYDPLNILAHFVILI